MSSNSADVGEEEDEEEGDLVKGPLETMFKQLIKDTTPPGDTITVCTNCSGDKDTTASLTLKLEKKEIELRYWQDCYETLLQQHFEDDRRGYDGAHETV